MMSRHPVSKITRDVLIGYESFLLYLILQPLTEQIQFLLGHVSVQTTERYRFFLQFSGAPYITPNETAADPNVRSANDTSTLCAQ
jgi:hypothetical protein